MSCRMKQRRRKVVPKMMTDSVFLCFFWSIALGQIFEDTESNFGKRDEFNLFLLRAFCPEGIRCMSLHRVFFFSSIPLTLHPTLVSPEVNK